MFGFCDFVNFLRINNHPDTGIEPEGAKMKDELRSRCAWLSNGNYGLFINLCHYIYVYMFVVIESDMQIIRIGIV